MKRKKICLHKWKNNKITKRRFIPRIPFGSCCLFLSGCLYLPVYALVCWCACVCSIVCGNDKIHHYYTSHSFKHEMVCALFRHLFLLFSSLFLIFSFFHCAVCILHFTSYWMFCNLILIANGKQNKIVEFEWWLAIEI